MLACAREIRTVVRQPPPVYLFSQTDEPTNITLFGGPGVSLVGVIFGKELGAEGSLTVGVSVGESGLDIGLILTTGTPTDELPVTANVGVDVAVGMMSGDLGQIQGPGRAHNIAVPAPLPPVLGLRVGVIHHFPYMESR